jgi:glycosyltransferase 2 family protein
LTLVRSRWSLLVKKLMIFRVGIAGTGSWRRWCRLVGPLLLAVMLWRVGPAACWSAVRGCDFRWFLAACLFSVPALWAKALRWQVIVRAVGGEFSFRECMGVYAAGMLAGAVTPGKVGDLAKAPLLAARGVSLADGIVASLVDRVLDGVVLLGLGLAGILALPLVPGRAAVAAAAVVAVVLTVAAALVFRKTLWRALRLTDFRHWTLLMATTLIASALYFASAYACAEALRLPLGVLDVCAGSAVAAVLALLPVSIAGIGTRDAAFVVIFARCGIDARGAIALSSLILAWMLVNCALFLVVSWRYAGNLAPPSFTYMGATSHDRAE